MPISSRAQEFDFDYNRNSIIYRGKVIKLSPHEADILRVLLNNRARPTPIGTLIQRVYGANEPDAAAVSIRVAIHSLRKKVQETGMRIRAEAKVGYEIEADSIPELNRRLHDKILMALNVACANEEHEIAEYLRAALELAMVKREKWLNMDRPPTKPAVGRPAVKPVAARIAAG
jgi:DNA-binding winged helix-turn-helix (wHTH) protein